MSIELMSILLDVILILMLIYENKNLQKMKDEIASITTKFNCLQAQFHTLNACTVKKEYHAYKNMELENMIREQAGDIQVAMTDICNEFTKKPMYLTTFPPHITSHNDAYDAMLYAYRFADYENIVHGFRKEDYHNDITVENQIYVEDTKEKGPNCFVYSRPQEIKPELLESQSCNRS